MRLDGKIYADYQATTPIDPMVIDTMTRLFTAEIGNPHASEHYFGWKAADAVRAAANTLAQSIGADADEIVFTSGATESNNLALLGLARRKREKRRKALISAIEHKSILAVGRELSRQLEIECVTIPVSAEGIIDIGFIEDQLDDTVMMVSIGAVNNEIGVIQPIETVGELTRKHDVFFHCDCAQAPCAIDINVINANIDLLSLSAHKLYGPQGIGALYVSRNLTNAVEPLIYGGGQQKGLRSGTLPVAMCAGFAKAIEIISQEQQTERDRVRQISKAFLSYLSELGVEFAVNGPLNWKLRHPGNNNIRLTNIDSHDVIASMQPRVAVSTGSACTSGTPESSYVLKSIGLSHDEALTSLRVSFGRFSTLEDAKDVAEAIKMAIDDLTAV